MTKRRRPYSAATCGALGPDVRVSPSYVRPACCNAIAGHKGEHVERNAETFGVLARWSKALAVEPGRRRG